ncbi:MAG: uracil-DNA glycosylase [Phycisphaerales bacterium]|nr:uracil-DNA glycosylase [Phycisphaerales bacterium]
MRRRMPRQRSPRLQWPRPPLPSLPEDALQELRARVLPCTKCKLAETRTHVVFGEGNPRAPVLFIGEAPGFHEDQQARPFVGPAGQLLDKIIEAAMGYARGDVFIANVNKCRPPENRNPEPDEVAACLPFLRAQVRIIRPGVIVCLGRVASSNLLGTSLPMRALRGQELDYEGIPVVVTWHPAYLLRTPSAKGETWADIRRVNRLLGRPEVPPRRDGS